MLLPEKQIWKLIEMYDEVGFLVYPLARVGFSLPV